MTPTIRPYTPADLAALHGINEASTPGVSSVSEDLLATIIDLGQCTVAVDEVDIPIGFLLAVPEGTSYKGKNYAWFTERYESFVYVDRIAIAPAARGQSIGAQLYANAFTAFAGQVPLIGCEVNAVPPNPGSLRFHTRLGFEEVGGRTFHPDYAVTYLARRLVR
ncbi:MAG: GNAT family N-acetyltransferase [Pseudomonadota bacterium]